MSWPSIDAVEFVISRCSDVIATFCCNTCVTFPPKVEFDNLSFSDGIEFIISDTLVWIDVGLTKIADGVVANRIEWVEITRTWCNAERTRPKIVTRAVAQCS